MAQFTQRVVKNGASPVQIDEMLIADKADHMRIIYWNRLLAHDDMGQIAEIGFKVSVYISIITIGVNVRTEK
ncbi:hypothetical protein D3C76_1650540 [compost metagenome]